MNRELNHTCIVCGEKYHFCDSCKDIASFTPWRTICDTAQHYQIFMIIKDYQTQNITSQEALQKLKMLHITRKEIPTFKPSTQAVLNEIFGEEKPVKQNTLTEQKTEKREG